VWSILNSVFNYYGIETQHTAQQCSQNRPQKSCHFQICIYYILKLGGNTHFLENNECEALQIPYFVFHGKKICT